MNNLSSAGFSVPENALIATLCNSIQALGRGFDVTSDIRLLYCKGAPGSRLLHIDDDQTRNLEISESCVIPDVSVDIECSRGQSYNKTTPVWSFREVMNRLQFLIFYLNSLFFFSVDFALWVFSFLLEWSFWFSCLDVGLWINVVI